MILILKENYLSEGYVFDTKHIVLIAIFLSDSIFSFIPGDFLANFLLANRISIVGFFILINWYKKKLSNPNPENIEEGEGERASLQPTPKSDFNLPLSNILTSGKEEFEFVSTDPEVGTIVDSSAKTQINIISLILIIAFALVDGRVFVILKEFQSTFEQSKILDFLNYPNFILVLLVSVGFHYEKIHLGAVRKIFISS